MAIRSLTALAASVLLLAAIPVAAKARCSGVGKQSRAIIEGLKVGAATPALVPGIAASGCRSSDATAPVGALSEWMLRTVDRVLGGWRKAQAAHFSEGASFDQIFTRR